MIRENAIKYVMVFTDGVSADSNDLEHESLELQSLVDKVFAFGIGNRSVNSLSGPFLLFS